ncbi:NAD(P)/FAD-dependent oxidoreductase [Parafilimonas sp.]|uniref:NAD(P)/FAD-dependent oxidoreductase n=1 Tax=Parafilimonas sp. TaxID=1969739 RepID=UPI0039E38A59
MVVIGGGIIGLSSALYLQRSGHKVTVIDKGNFTDNCSYGNLGYVCPSHFIPLAAPGIVWQGIKWMFNSRSPFYVQPSLNVSLIDWGLKFMRSATQKNVESAATPLKNIAVFSQDEYKQWEKIEGFDMAFEQKGMLEIFKTGKVAQHAAHTVKTGKQLGLDVELLNAEGLQALEPQTKINALGAINFKCDAHLYPDKLMASLKNYLPKQGVELIHGEVTGFEKANGKITKVLCGSNAYDADEVIVATGSWSREVAAMLDTKIPLMPGRGYSFTLENPEYKLNHPAILTEGRVAITPFENGKKMRYGGTMEVVGTKAPPRYHRVEGIIDAIKDFLPEFKIDMPSQDKIWFGYRPTSADGLPYIGRIKKYKNVTVATGHSMLGLSLGAGTGKLVSELINGQTPGVDLKAFEVERFNF